MIFHLIALVIAYILDLILGDPPRFPHPVRLFGNLIHYFEKRWNQGRYRTFKGALMLTFLIIIVFGTALGLLLLTYTLNVYLGLILEAILIWTTIAQKGLKEAAIEVERPLSHQNIADAREKLSYIVGRDTNKLSNKDIVRGTVETVAENTIDGITAPIFWAMIGGAPLALVYRLINTCDSMVGYKNNRYKEFGWASARLDDVVNWLPSRLTGLLMIFSYRSKEIPFKKAWSILWRDANKHPSPNSGWGEAAVAALLGVRLGGINYYQGEPSHRTEMGDAVHELQINDISKSLIIMRRTSLLFLLCMLIGGVIIDITFTWL